MGHHRFKLVLEVNVDVEEATKNKQLPPDTAIEGMVAQRLNNLDVGDGYTVSGTTAKITKKTKQS